ncbi:RNA polymerase sigma factor [Pedobacter sp. ASV12]|uniref:RNA polymerase sigma factor n=1 Tax=Pedobacter sp. ASV12 TaxID=2795120 RepID=UPI0018EB09A1|nr:RNA polymerase sigma-70 factor [Pedobacter sp. ASV12]
MSLPLKTGDDHSLLLSQLKKGDSNAFGSLYDLYSRMLLSNIIHMVKDQEVAKELLQDLFLKVWEKRESIDVEKSFKSFLFTIAKNKVYDYLRKVALDKKLTRELIANTIESYSHTEELLSFKEKNACLNQAIEALSPQSRQVYQLSKIEGLSHKEISERLGISVSTCLLYTSPSPRDSTLSRMPASA